VVDWKYIFTVRQASSRRQAVQGRGRRGKGYPRTIRSSEELPKECTRRPDPGIEGLQKRAWRAQARLAGRECRGEGSSVG